MYIFLNLCFRIFTLKTFYGVKQIVPKNCVWFHLCKNFFFNPQTIEFKILYQPIYSCSYYFLISYVNAYKFEHLFKFEKFWKNKRFWNKKKLIYFINWDFIGGNLFGCKPPQSFISSYLHFSCNNRQIVLLHLH